VEAIQHPREPPRRDQRIVIEQQDLLAGRPFQALVLQFLRTMISASAFGRSAGSARLRRSTSMNCSSPGFTVATNNGRNRSRIPESA
jgi:hypothetical protein